MTIKMNTYLKFQIKSSLQWHFIHPLVSLNTLFKMGSENSKEPENIFQNTLYILQ